MRTRVVSRDVLFTLNVIKSILSTDVQHDCLGQKYTEISLMSVIKCCRILKLLNSKIESLNFTDTGCF